MWGLHQGPWPGDPILDEDDEDIPPPRLIPHPLPRLPSNVLQCIFRYLDVVDISRLKQVCRFLSIRLRSSQAQFVRFRDPDRIKILHQDLQCLGDIGARARSLFTSFAFHWDEIPILNLSDVNQQTEIFEVRYGMKETTYCTVFDILNNYGDAAIRLEFRFPGAFELIQNRLAPNGIELQPFKAIKILHLTNGLDKLYQYGSKNPENLFISIRDLCRPTLEELVIDGGPLADGLPDNKRYYINPGRRKGYSMHAHSSSELDKSGLRFENLRVLRLSNLPGVHDGIIAYLTSGGAMRDITEGARYGPTGSRIFEVVNLPDITATGLMYVLRGVAHAESGIGGALKELTIILWQELLDPLCSLVENHNWISKRLGYGDRPLQLERVIPTDGETVHRRQNVSTKEWGQLCKVIEESCIHLEKLNIRPRRTVKRPSVDEKAGNEGLQKRSGNKGLGQSEGKFDAHHTLRVRDGKARRLKINGGPSRSSTPATPDLSTNKPIPPLITFLAPRRFLHSDTLRITHPKSTAPYEASIPRSRRKVGKVPVRHESHGKWIEDLMPIREQRYLEYIEAKNFGLTLHQFLNGYSAVPPNKKEHIPSPSIRQFSPRHVTRNSMSSLDLRRFRNQVGKNPTRRFLDTERGLEDARAHDQRKKVMEEAKKTEERSRQRAQSRAELKKQVLALSQELHRHQSSSSRMIQRVLAEAVQLSMASPAKTDASVRSFGQDRESLLRDYLEPIDLPEPPKGSEFSCTYEKPAPDPFILSPSNSLMFNRSTPDLKKPLGLSTIATPTTSPILNSPTKERYGDNILMMRPTRGVSNLMSQADTPSEDTEGRVLTAVQSQSSFKSPVPLTPKRGRHSRHVTLDTPTPVRSIRRASTFSTVSSPASDATGVLNIESILHNTKPSLPMSTETFMNRLLNERDESRSHQPVDDTTSSAQGDESHHSRRWEALKGTMFNFTWNGEINTWKEGDVLTSISNGPSVTSIATEEPKVTPEPTRARQQSLSTTSIVESPSTESSNSRKSAKTESHSHRPQRGDRMDLPQISSKRSRQNLRAESEHESSQPAPVEELLDLPSSPTRKHHLSVSSMADLNDNYSDDVSAVTSTDYTQETMRSTEAPPLLLIPGLLSPPHWHMGDSSRLLASRRSSESLSVKDVLDPQSRDENNQIARKYNIELTEPRKASIETSIVLKALHDRKRSISPSTKFLKLLEKASASKKRSSISGSDYDPTPADTSSEKGLVTIDPTCLFLPVPLASKGVHDLYKETPQDNASKAAKGIEKFFLKSPRSTLVSGHVEDDTAYFDKWSSSWSSNTSETPPRTPDLQDSPAVTLASVISAESISTSEKQSSNSPRQRIAQKDLSVPLIKTDNPQGESSRAVESTLARSRKSMEPQALGNQKKLSMMDHYLDENTSKRYSSHLADPVYIGPHSPDRTIIPEINVLVPADYEEDDTVLNQQMEWGGLSWPKTLDLFPKVPVRALVADPEWLRPNSGNYKTRNLHDHEQNVEDGGWRNDQLLIETEVETADQEFADDVGQWRNDGIASESQEPARTAMACDRRSRRLL
ncbi:hypothetical protein EX30DRAFT_364696 [Ascodesmis nigricans]|uniref:F-box domain-containing protein n=1 Tax=Ascodesmis nigricans TaxID=341454 RepID=A0A4S2MUF3_9PEZI|nr:hypothetical protein EX30DRAFT_364696 [Ascodesmis nigricans]